MSFWDNVKKFAQPYADDDEYDDEYDDEEVDGYDDEGGDEPAPRARRGAEAPAAGFGFGAAPAAPAATPSNASGGFSGTVLNSNSGKQEVVLFCPSAYNDVSEAATHLRAKKAVVVNMEGKDPAMSRRVVDFMSGCAYALDGTVRKIAKETYLFCPYNMAVIGDLESLQNEVDSYV